MPEPAEVSAETVAALEAELAELRPLKDSSAAAQADFKAKEDAWKTEKAELEQAANPNWRKAREQIAALQAAAKEKGVELDTEGSPVPKGTVDAEAITRQAREEATSATKQEFLNNRLDELLEDFSDDDAKVVRNLYGKVTAGETITMQNIRGFVTQAVNAAGFERPNPLNRGAGRGTGPRPPTENVGLSDESAAATAALMGLKIKGKK